MSNEPANIIGVLLAAGRSRRMGQPKQVLPWPPYGNAERSRGGQNPKPRSTATVVSAAYDIIAPFCADMIVVVGYVAEDVVSALRPRVFNAVYVDPDAEMAESVRLGLQAALRWCVARGGLGEHGSPETPETSVVSAHPPPITRSTPPIQILLHPGDLPAVNRATVGRLVLEAAGHPRQAVMPEFGGKGGHPVLIPEAVARTVVHSDLHGGLRAYWRRNQSIARRIPVDDPGVVSDIDTPEDYVSPIETRLD